MASEAGERTNRPYSGRYFAEYVRLAPESDHQATVQEALDAGSDRSWHLVGVEGEVADCAAILFWDTDPPGFVRGFEAR